MSHGVGDFPLSLSQVSSSPAMELDNTVVPVHQHAHKPEE